jgi:hypothetical protein
MMGGNHSTKLTAMVISAVDRHLGGGPSRRTSSPRHISAKAIAVATGTAKPTWVWTTMLAAIAMPMR